MLTNPVPSSCGSFCGQHEHEIWPPTELIRTDAVQTLVNAVVSLQERWTAIMVERRKRSTQNAVDIRVTVKDGSKRLACLVEFGHWLPILDINAAAYAQPVFLASHAASDALKASSKPEDLVLVMNLVNALRRNADRGMRERGTACHAGAGRPWPKPKSW